MGKEGEEEKKETILDTIDSDELADLLGNEVEGDTGKSGDDDKKVDDKVDEEKTDEEKTDDALKSDDEKKVDEKLDDKKVDEKLDEKKVDEKLDEKKADEKSDDKKVDDDKKSDDEVIDETLDKALELKVEDEKKIVDYNVLSKDILGEEIGTENTKEAFKAKYEAKLVEASKKVDLSGFSEDAQKLFKHLNEGDGSLTDFYTDAQLREYDRFLALTPRDMVKEAMELELKKDVTMTSADIAAEISEKIDALEDSRVKEITDGFIKNVGAKRSEHITSIISQSQTKIDSKIAADKVTLTKEITEIKGEIDKLEEIDGLKLLPKHKELLKAHVDSGEFDNVLSKNPAEVKVKTYLRLKLGEQIKAKQIETAEKEKTEAKEDGKKSERSKNHNVPPKTGSKSSPAEEADDDVMSGFHDAGLYGLE